MFVSVLAAAVLVIAGGIAAIVVTATSSGSSPARHSADEAAGTSVSAPASPVASWGIGSCVKQTGGPTTQPTLSDPRVNAQLEALKTWGPALCDDPDAVAKITAIGPQAAPRTSVPATACPATTDHMYQDDDTGRVYCGRFLTGPHPGDPGGGGGTIVVGDCVGVGSDNPGVPGQDVSEEACGQGFFASVLATAPNAAACPAAALSRLPSPDDPSAILCLGQGDGGLIAAPGDCFQQAGNYYYPGIRVDCSQSDLETLVSFAGAGGTCPSGTHAAPQTGYDRKLCLRYADGS